MTVHRGIKKRWLAPLVLALTFFCCQRAEPPPNLIFISLDTTRHDFINTGRGARANTPELKRFARQAVVMENAFATIPQTLPSHLSIFTSRFPHELGVEGNDHHYDGRHKMIQEVLKERGYHTAGVISLGSVSGKTGISRGFDEYNESLFTPTRFYVDGAEITRTALDMLDAFPEKPFFMFAHYSDPHSPYAPPDKQSDFSIRLNGKPVAGFNAFQGGILRLDLPLPKGEHTLTFSNEKSEKDFRFFVIRRLRFSENCRVVQNSLEYSPNHYRGSHLLRASRGWVKISCAGSGWIRIFQVIPILTKEAAIKYYTREVEYLDKQVGAFLKGVEKRDLLKNTIVAIFADHGEGLGERDGYFGHVRYLNQQFIHVPMMIRLPGRSPRRVHAAVSLTGLTPTLLDFMDITDHGIPIPENWRPLITGNKKRAHRGVVSFAFEPSAVSDKLSVIHWPFQAIFNPGATGLPAREFYNLGLSPSFSRFDRIHQEVMITSSSSHYRTLVKEIRHHRRVFSRHSRLVKADNASLEKLRMLGYID